MERMTRWETEALRRSSGRPRPGSPAIDLRESARPEPDEPAPGTLLVPLDAWQRMLDQLGHLHEAGQQLADVSARAAKAETEAEFLRERVAELRGQLAETRQGDTDDGPSPDERSAPESRMSVAVTRVRSLYSRLRTSRRAT